MWFIGFAQRLQRLQRMYFCTVHLVWKSNSLFANRVWQASNTYASCQICHMCNAFIYMTPAAMDKICRSLGMKSDQTAPRKKCLCRTKQEQLTQKRKKSLFCLLSSAESIIDCFDKGRGEPVQFNEKGRVFRRSRDCVPLSLF